MVSRLGVGLALVLAMPARAQVPTVRDTAMDAVAAEPVTR
jgi:hypothetical protein